MVSSLRINIKEVLSLNSNVGKAQRTVSSVSSDISTQRQRISSDILARRDLSFRLSRASHAAGELALGLTELEFFTKISMSKYKEADEYLARIKSEYGLAEEKRRISDILKDAAGTVLRGTLLVSGGILFVAIPATLNVGKAVVAGSKKVYSVFKQIYKPDWGQVGKAALKIGFGISSVLVGAAAVSAVLATGIAAAPVVATAMAIAGGIYGLNSIASGTYDLTHALFGGNYSNIGTFNFLKNQVLGDFGAYVGKWINNEELGRKIGEVIYYGGSISTAAYGLGALAGKAYKGVKAAGSIRSFLSDVNVGNAVINTIKAAKKVGSLVEGFKGFVKK